MITIVNEQNKDKYNFLFDKANEALGLKGDEEIHDLEAYFSRIGDLKAHSVLVNRLPVDEPAFEINANSRVISVPQNFKINGISVQGDTYAETLIFKVNRFVDAMDLANDDIEIYAQWKLPDGKEGASILREKDWDRENGYLYFYWPLSGKLTEQAGSIQSSIRFFKKAGQDIAYSFNTLPIVLNIKTALRPVLDYLEKDTETPSYLEGIANSDNISTDIPVQKPIFNKNFKENFNENGTQKMYAPEEGNLVLKAQAYSTDTGKISYKWDRITSDPLASAPLESAALQYIPTQDSVADKNKKYYVEVSGEKIAYKENPFNETLAKEGKLFEEISTYKVPVESGDIIGTYKVTATNTVRPTAKQHSSRTCVIPGPEVLTFESNLPSDIFIPESLSVEMKVDQVPAGAKKPGLAYSWFKTTTNPEGSLEAVSESVGEWSTKTVTPQDAGWYRVQITSTLNGANKIENSDICRVLKDPIAPTFNASSLKGGNYTKANVEGQVTVGFEKLDSSNKLLSDSIKYEWYDNDVLVEPGNPSYTYVTGLDTNTLKFDWSKKTQILPDAWRCKITNVLNGKTATTGFSGYFMITES